MQDLCFDFFLDFECTFKLLLEILVLLLDEAGLLLIALDNLFGLLFPFVNVFIDFEVLFLVDHLI